MTILGTIRFLAGATLVAAGATLVAPLATRLAAAARPVNAPAAMGAVPPAPAPAGNLAPTPPVTAAPAVPPSPADWGMTQEPAWADVSEPLPDSGGGLQLDRSLPPPPAPLPPVSQQLSQSSPALGAAYRSTLEVPPPPLLDAAAPPPASLAWATPGIPTGADAMGPTGVANTTDATVPPTYRVADGDDLGTIAGRFYGHPAAASAIWAANRETIPDPDVLPIGIELRLPRPWAVRGNGRTVSGAIEPVAYTRPAAPATAGPQPAAHAVPWLGPAGPVTAVPTPTTVAPALPITAPPAPGAMGVKVAPGETLGSLAQRLYGDPAMASQIFAVNRDRLRSPDLVVPGMELRLPRPVTVPRS